VKSTQAVASTWQQHIIGKQDNGKLNIPVVLIFVFDFEIK